MSWTIEKLEKKMARLNRLGIKLGNMTLPKSDAADGDIIAEQHYRLWTEKHVYYIIAKERSIGRSYLGCIVSTRASCPGENWTRGHDLADGILSAKTWHRILADIVAYETIALAVHVGETTIEEMPEEPIAEDILVA